MRLIPLYAVLNIVADIPYYIWHNKGTGHMIGIYGYVGFDLFEIGFFSYLLCSLIKSARLNKIVLTANVLLDIASIVQFFILHHFGIDGLFVMFYRAIGCFLVVILCFMYIRAMFSRSQMVELIKAQYEWTAWGTWYHVNFLKRSKFAIINFNQDPAFWFVMGTTFYFSLHIPTLVSSNVLYYLNKDTVAADIYTLNGYSQIITYALFIKAMTCRRPQSL